MKIIRTGGRGTTRRVAEKEEDNWAGPGFIEYSKQQKDAAKDMYVSMDRGTTKIRFGDIADTAKKSSTKGAWISTGRGTGKRKIE